MTTIAQIAAAFVVLVLDWITGASRHEPVRQGAVVRFVLKHPLATTGAIVTVVGVAVVLTVVSGVIPIRASSGHWPITERILDFTKLQSVRTWSLGIETPSLDDAYVVRGASHYAIGCEPCHGAPNGLMPPVMTGMTPHPPRLEGERLTRWTPPQLFTIVKHGIKFTGMPAWLAQGRDDEVWAVVAFLQRLPGMDAATYRRLSQGAALAARPSSTPSTASPQPASTPTSDGSLATTTAESVPVPEIIGTVCARCHGVDGTGRDGSAFPSLAGQRAVYIESALRAYADRSRPSGAMSQLAARLNDAEIRDIARYYEQLPGRTPLPARDPASAARGAALATQGAPARLIPACVECHGPATVPKNPAYPTLAGQHAAYLVEQLDLLKQRRRGGSPRVNLMHAFVDRLQLQDIRDVARYYASTAPSDGP